MDTSWLGDSYCVSLIRDLAADTALNRLGGDQVRVLTLAEAVQLGRSFDAGYPLIAVATRASSPAAPRTSSSRAATSTLGDASPVSSSCRYDLP